MSVCEEGYEFDHVAEDMFTDWSSDIMFFSDPPETEVK